MHPNQDWGRSTGTGGITRAIALPYRVTRIGWPVLSTCANTARQVALNFEIEIVGISSFASILEM